MAIGSVGNAAAGVINSGASSATGVAVGGAAMSAQTEAAVRGLAMAGNASSSVAARPNINASIEASTVPKMGAEGVLARAKDLMPESGKEVRDGSLGARREKMLEIASDPAAPPDLRSFMLQSYRVSGGEKNVALDFYQKKDLNVLKQHPDAFPLTAENIQSKIDDPSTPPDLKAALTRVKDDPNMSILLDTGKHGGGLNKADGKITFGDVEGLAEKQTYALAANSASARAGATTGAGVITGAGATTGGGVITGAGATTMGSAAGAAAAAQAAAAGQAALAAGGGVASTMGSASGAAAAAQAAAAEAALAAAAGAAVGPAVLPLGTPSRESYDAAVAAEASTGKNMIGVPSYDSYIAGLAAEANPA
ncbi:MAG: HrpF/NolX family T3SS translocon protein [Pseudomonadota bacterium]